MSEESPTDAAVIDDADQHEMAVLRTDEGDCGDLSGPPEHDPQRSGGVRLGGERREEGAHAVPGLAVEPHALTQIVARQTRLFRDAGGRDAVADPVRLQPPQLDPPLAGHL